MSLLAIILFWLAIGFMLNLLIHPNIIRPTLLECVLMLFITLLGPIGWAVLLILLGLSLFGR